MFDRTRFYPSVAPMFDGHLQPHQEMGLSALLTEWEAVPAHHEGGLPRLAWILAIATVETLRVLSPIKEFKQGEGQPYAAPDPVSGKRYYGRGFAPLQGRSAYEAAAVVLGDFYGRNAPGTDLVDSPEIALQVGPAAKILFEGVKRAWFSGIEMPEGFDAGDAPIGGHHFVAGMDRMDETERYYRGFLAALREA